MLSAQIKGSVEITGLSFDNELITIKALTAGSVNPEYHSNLESPLLF